MACIDNKDLAEVILKNMNADTEESEVNAITPLLVVKNNNDNVQLNNKKHTHDDWRVDSIPRVSSEERRTPTPLDVGDKHFLNSISDQKGYAEELFNSRNGHQSVEDGCGHRDVNIISYQDSGMDSDKDSDEIQTSLFTEIEESEKSQGTLEVLDEVLGEGEYGIVYKGRYGGWNGSILTNLRKTFVFIHVIKFTGQGNQVARKLDLAEILKTNISKELYPVKIIEEVNSQKDIFVNFQNYANEL